MAKTTKSILTAALVMAAAGSMALQAGAAEKAKVDIFQNKLIRNQSKLV